MSLVVVLATVGFGYALWSSTLFVKAEVNTGAVSAEFTRAFTDDDDKVDDTALDSLDTGDCPLPPGSQTSCDPAASGPDPKARHDTDVGRCEAEVVAPDVGQVTKDRVYPGYFCTAWFEVHNDGSVPVRIARASVNGVPVIPSIATPFDLDGDGVDDLAIHLTGFNDCQQVDPSERLLIDIDQEILPGAPQGSTLSYQVEYTLQQWNEACVEVDQFPKSEAIVGILAPDGTITTARLAGPTTVQVNLAALADPDGDGQEQVQTEIVSMSLTSTSPIPVEVRLQADRRSLGEIEEAANTQAGRLDLPPFAPGGTADSFFDVFFEIEISGQVLHNEDPLQMAATITNKPPAPGEGYVMTEGRLPLFDPAGKNSGFFLVEASYIPNPQALPDLVVREIRGPTLVACTSDPRGQDVCDAAVGLTITNLGGADAGTFQVVVEGDQMLPMTIDVAGLTAGGSAEFLQIMRPGNHCFDPDCTVTVTVDAGEAVAESDETNNVATRTATG